MSFVLAVVLAAAAQTPEQISFCIPANEILKSAQFREGKTLDLVRAYNAMPEASRKKFKPMMDEAYASAMRLRAIEAAFVSACASR